MNEGIPDRPLEAFEAGLSAEVRALFRSLSHPTEIQAFLDQIPYSPEERNRCIRNVLRDRLAHCLDGGLFAAAALRRLGFPPLIVDLLPQPGRDDDHVLAIFKIDGCYGAVAKSNFVGLRYREPIHRTLRELALSYFEAYFNVRGEKTLRGYTRPVRLTALDKYDWMSSDVGADAVEKHLKTLQPIPLLTAEMIARLAPVDARSYDAGLVGADSAGLYRPGAASCLENTQRMGKTTNSLL